MSSVRRWVLTHTELEAVVHDPIPVPVGKILLSQMFLSKQLSKLVRKFWYVGVRARFGSLCPCDRQVLVLPSRHAMVSIRDTQRIL